jgi:hypothetical protein
MIRVRAGRAILFDVDDSNLVKIEVRRNKLQCMDMTASAGACLCDRSSTVSTAGKSRWLIW